MDNAKMYSRLEREYQMILRMLMVLAQTGDEDGMKEYLARKYELERISELLEIPLVDGE